jgi:hypothetical protein
MKLVSTSDLTGAVYGPCDICLLRLYLRVLLFALKVRKVNL